MAYGGQLIDITWLFSITGTEEIAVTSLRYSTVLGWNGAVAALAEIAAYPGIGPALLAPMGTLMASSGLQWADYSRLNGWKAAAVGTDGHYLTEPVTYSDTTPDAGAWTQVVPQSSVVMSLDSGFKLGPGNRGRLYLPHCRGGMASTTPYIDSANQAAIAVSSRTFVNAVTAAINAATTPIVFPVIAAKGGTLKGVTEVRVGRVNDTQRRRRNRLTEDYAVQSL